MTDSTVPSALAALQSHLSSTQRSVLPFAALVSAIPTTAACFMVNGGHVARTTIVLVEGGVSVLLDYVGDGP